MLDELVYETEKILHDYTNYWVEPKLKKSWVKTNEQYKILRLTSHSSNHSKF